MPTSYTRIERAIVVAPIERRRTIMLNYAYAGLVTVLGLGLAVSEPTHGITSSGSYRFVERMPFFPNGYGAALMTLGILFAILMRNEKRWRIRNVVLFGIMVLCGYYAGNYGYGTVLSLIEFHNGDAKSAPLLGPQAFYLYAAIKASANISFEREVHSRLGISGAEIDWED